jgi:hypothetical protein
MQMPMRPTSARVPPRKAHCQCGTALGDRGHLMKDIGSIGVLLELRALKALA